jgi:hypothetical protein
MRRHQSVAYDAIMTVHYVDQVYVEFPVLNNIANRAAQLLPVDRVIDSIFSTAQVHSRLL